MIKRKWKAASIVAMAAVAAAALVGCSAGPASQPGNSVLDEVIERGTLRVATIQGNAPWGSVNSAGDLEGYDIEVAKLLAERMGVELELVRVDVAGRISALESNTADVTIALLSRDRSRAKSIAFTDPYMAGGTQILVAESSPAQTLDDLNSSDVTVAVPRGGTQEQTVPAVLPEANVLAFPGVADVVAALTAGQAQVGAVDYILAAKTAADPANGLRVIPGVFAPSEVSIGLKRGDFQWWLYVNQFVNEINADGTNYNLIEEWMGITPPHFVQPATK